MVRKGSLTVIQKILKGVVKFYVVNEKKEVCIENTSMLWEDKIYNADKDDGKILIPMNKSDAKTGKVIIISGDFATIASITIPKESYHLHFEQVYNEERLLPGTMCEFILVPELTCSDVSEPVALSHLIDAQVTVEHTNQSGIKSKEVYKDLDVSERTDIVINY